MNRVLREGQDFTPLGQAVTGVVLQAIAARRQALAAQGLADRPEFAALLDAVEVEARQRLGGV